MYWESHPRPLEEQSTLLTTELLNPVVYDFNSSPREDYKIGGDSSQSQSHSEIPGGRIAISDWGRGKSQWLAALLF